MCIPKVSEQLRDVPAYLRAITGLDYKLYLSVSLYEIRIFDKVYNGF